MKKPILYLFVGYPGAGKTTVAKLIAETTGAMHLWADFQRHVLFERPTHTKQESRDLYDHLNQVADDLLAEGHSVIYDTNFNFRSDRDRLRSIANRNGAQAIVVWVTTDRALAETRATKDSADQPTRIWGNMSLGDFNRLSDHLQQPDTDETVVQIDGSHVTEDSVKAALGL